MKDCCCGKERERKGRKRRGDKEKEKREKEREERERETKELRIVNRNIKRQMEQNRVGKHTDVEK